MKFPSFIGVFALIFVLEGEPFSGSIPAMRSTLQNHLNMVGACLDVAQKPEYHAVWSGQTPTRFGDACTELIKDYAEINKKAAQAESAPVGAGDAKAVAETALEDAIHVLSSALVVHFSTTGDASRRAKADLTPSSVARLRSQELLTTAREIQDLATGALSEPGADGCGITAERIVRFSETIEVFAKVLTHPRSQVTTRGALLNEIGKEVARFLGVLEHLDRLVLQFGVTAPGQEFIEAWRRSRVIVDLGGAIPKRVTPPTTPAPQPPPA